jgi:hypothetical protein
VNVYQSAPISNAHSPRIFGDVQDYIDVCAIEAWYFKESLKPLQLAVDQLQSLAALWGIIDRVGQDLVQAIMAEAFGRGRVCEIDKYDNRGKDDIRPAPLEDTRPRRGRVAQSTIDAFRLVLSLGKPDALAAWLSDHPKDAVHLLKLLETV